MKRDELEHVSERPPPWPARMRLSSSAARRSSASSPTRHHAAVLPGGRRLPRAQPERAIEIDGALGDGSQFHETFGYYAQESYPRLPKPQDADRSIPVSIRPLAGPHCEVTGWCLEAHDLVLSNWSPAETAKSTSPNRPYATTSCNHKSCFAASAACRSTTSTSSTCDRCWKAPSLRQRHRPRDRPET